MTRSGLFFAAKKRPDLFFPLPAPLPRLLGLATANPPLRLEQVEIARRMERMWGLHGAEAARWRRIVAGTEIDARFGVIPPEDVFALSTQQRMEVYEREAPSLAEAAGRAALADAGVEPDRVSDLIVVSCTGFSAPGIDVALVERLGLPATVRRTIVGFMGCFGAIVGLRTAAGACAADPRAVALVVCVELCSLHVRADRDPQNLVASALFSDGAAAAVVGPAPGNGTECNAGLASLASWRSWLLREGRDWMSWRITDSGFAMTLDRQVPLALGRHLGDVSEAYGRAPACWIVHPGGPGILDAVDDALGLGGRGGIESARMVLRRFGNMSSATILFVLAEAFRAGGHEPPALLVAFGPGLSVETMLLER